MHIIGGKKDRKDTLLERYGARLGTVVQHQRAELALLAAKQDAEQAARLAREAMLEAQAANQAKAEFLANMSHELRTPLNAIIGFSDMMIKGLLNPEEAGRQLDYATSINESGRHLLELINDILDLAKVEAGKLELNETEVDLRTVCASCVSLIKVRADERGLVLEDRSPKEPIQLRADERKLKQVLANLLSNAVKFTPPGGTVTLASALEADGSLVIWVTDTGIGIARDDLDKALAPFMQADSGLERVYEGTGLGLPLTKALIELHDGKLELQSELGIGTTATLRLPAERVTTAAEPDPGSGAKPGRKRKGFGRKSRR